MKRMTLTKTLLAVVLAGCAATATAETVGTMTMAACHLTHLSVTGAGSFSNEARTGTDTSGLTRIGADGMITDGSTLPTDGMGTGDHLGTGDTLPPSLFTTDDNKTGDPSPVPEASTTAMMLVGFTLLGGMLRKKRKVS
ncbi:MAG: PEP-CTERM sorting domain-containing protein [Acidiferrobacteraceae bacterium]